MLNFFIGLLFVVVFICALGLIGIILIQQSKSGGGLAVMGGGMTESVLGAAAGNIVTRITVVLATLFLVCTFLLAILITRREKPQSYVERYEEGNAPPPQEEPALPDQDGEPQEPPQ